MYPLVFHEFLIHLVSFYYSEQNYLWQTFLGKIFGGFCALVGVFTLTLPIPIVVNSFAGFYKNRLWRNEVAQKKKERIQSQKEGGYQGMECINNQNEVRIIKSLFSLSHKLGGEPRFHMNGPKSRHI